MDKSLARLTKKMKMQITKTILDFRKCLNIVTLVWGNKLVDYKNKSLEAGVTI